MEVLHVPEKCIAKPEKCKRAKQDDWLKMHFVGTLEDGTKFDSTRDKGYGKPLEFRLGGQGVIPGWTLAAKDMVIGEKRKVIIPPHLAYGDRKVEQVTKTKHQTFVDNFSIK